MPSDTQVIYSMNKVRRIAQSAPDNKCCATRKRRSASITVPPGTAFLDLTARRSMAKNKTLRPTASEFLSCLIDTLHSFTSSATNSPDWPQAVMFCFLTFKLNLLRYRGMQRQLDILIQVFEKDTRQRQRGQICRCTKLVDGNVI